jgi:hypothetical protein
MQLSARPPRQEVQTVDQRKAEGRKPSGALNTVRVHTAFSRWRAGASRRISSAMRDPVSTPPEGAHPPAVWPNGARTHQSITQIGEKDLLTRQHARGFGRLRFHLARSCSFPSGSGESDRGRKREANRCGRFQIRRHASPARRDVAVRDQVAAARRTSPELPRCSTGVSG